MTEIKLHTGNRLGTPNYDKAITPPEVGDFYERPGCAGYYTIQDVSYWPRVWLTDRFGAILMVNHSEFLAMEKIEDESLVGLILLSRLP